VNILFVIPRMGVGGAERVIVTLCRGLQARGHQVSVASEGGAYADLLSAQEGVPQHMVPGMAGKDPRSLLRSALALRELIDRIRPDIINAHAYSTVLVAHAARRFARHRPPLTFTLHAPVRHQSYYVMGPTLNHLVDDLSAVCAFSRRQLYEHGLPQGRGTVLYNGIDQTWLAPLDAIEARPVVGSRSPIRAGVLARLIEAKGVQSLIEALALLKAKGDHRYTLEVAGDGPYRGELERLARTHGLADRVTFQGRRDDAAAFLDGIDLYILPSYAEAFPVSILEAMARGIPVLSSAVGGVPEVVTEGRTGYMFPTRHVPALVRALERIADEPEKTAAVRREARALVEAKYLTEHMVNGYERWFQRVINGSTILAA